MHCRCNACSLSVSHLSRCMSMRAIAQGRDRAGEQDWTECAHVSRDSVTATVAHLNHLNDVELAFAK